MRCDKGNKQAYLGDFNDWPHGLGLVHGHRVVIHAVEISENALLNDIMVEVDLKVGEVVRLWLVDGKVRCLVTSKLEIR